MSLIRACVRRPAADSPLVAHALDVHVAVALRLQRVAALFELLASRKEMR